jgi:hypothetical protein
MDRIDRIGFEIFKLILSILSIHVNSYAYV